MESITKDETIFCGHCGREYEMDEVPEVCSDDCPSFPGVFQTQGDIDGAFEDLGGV